MTQDPNYLFIIVKLNTPLKYIKLKNIESHKDRCQFGNLLGAGECSRSCDVSITVFGIWATVGSNPALPFSSLVTLSKQLPFAEPVFSPEKWR